MTTINTPEEIQDRENAAYAWGRLSVEHPHIDDKQAIAKLASEILAGRRIGDLNEDELGGLVHDLARKFRETSTISGSVEKLRREAGWEW